MKIIKDLNMPADKDLGLVATMGYLHEGHLSLVKRAKAKNDKVVVSIYVNPTQFGKGEDLDKYPRDIDRDIKLLEQLDVDYLFLPDDKLMYPDGFRTYVSEQELSKRLCGQQRPTHFKGVLTIVLKLFNIIRPKAAYFGQKDYQQYLLIKNMVKDLNLGLSIEMCPIIREQDGLAKSSRNKYLSPVQRKQAICLYDSLILAKKLIDRGERKVSYIKEHILKNIERFDLAMVDYVEILDKDTLCDIEHISSDDTLIAMAIRIGNTRLIDNIII